MSVEFRRLDRAHGVNYLVLVPTVYECMNDLLCVADYGDVRAMRHHNQLTTLLYILDDRDEQAIDRVIIQVLFG